jgi:hypothetical protein
VFRALPAVTTEQPGVFAGTHSFHDQMKYYCTTTEFNCGIDLHARQMYVCVMDRQGRKLVHCNVRNNDFEFFLKLVQPYRHSLPVCCESKTAFLTSIWE